jgi:uncharacterized protein YndB with AHSA1/START domain
MTLSRKTARAATVKRSVVLDAPPDEVWEALTDAVVLSDWLAPEVELDPREGGEIVCRYEDGEERRGQIELVEEAERLAFEWRRKGGAPSRVELLIDAVAGGTRVTVSETAADVTASPLLATSWVSPLASLRLVMGRLVLA